MKASLFSLIFVFLLLSCANNKLSKTNEMPAEIQFQIDAGQFLDDWHKAAGNANFDNYFTKIADDGVYIGTDASEVWSKSEFKTFSKPFFDKGRAWDFKATQRNLYLSDDGKYIWFDELLDTWMGTCRGSGVLKVKEGKNENTFQLKHYVLSLTIPNDKMRDVMNTIQQKKEQ